jgi:glucosylceramidase
MAGKMKYTKFKTITTSRDTDDRLHESPWIHLCKEDEKNKRIIKINPEITFQKIIGFGGSFTESTAWVLNQLSKIKRTEIINQYFHPADGHGYNLCRTHMNSCDFSHGNYAAGNTPGDINLENFDINREKEYLIPLIQDAQMISEGSFKLILSPWSPPGWMKTNQKMNHGGRLLREYYPVWADYFVKFIKAYKDEGIKFWGITPQNEPEATQTWDSCRYTGEEEKTFVRDYLGPKVKNAFGEQIKILIWDHNRDMIVQRGNEILSDPKAAKYIWGIGFHWYSGNDSPNLTKIHDLYPEKQLILTEATIEGGVKLGKWDRGEIYAKHIIADLNNWCSGWIDWNMVLDIHGGPNHVGNYCDAPILVNTDSKEVYYQSSFYYLGHFSRYIKPGSVRIQCQSNVDGIHYTAFKDQDSSITVVILNIQKEDSSFSIKIENHTIKCVVPKRTIKTLIIQ